VAKRINKQRQSQGLRIKLGARILLRGHSVPSERDPRGRTHDQAVPISGQVLGHNVALLLVKYPRGPFNPAILSLIAYL
jgi:hypothetical protein